MEQSTAQNWYRYQYLWKLTLVKSLFLIKELEPNKLWDINLYKIESSYHNAPKYQIQLRFYHCFSEQSNFLKFFHIAIYMKLWTQGLTMNKTQDLPFDKYKLPYHTDTTQQIFQHFYCLLLRRSILGHHFVFWLLLMQKNARFWCQISTNKSEPYFYINL